MRTHDGITYFDINDEGDKQVKNEQSKRRVPIHPVVVRLGFLEYVDRIAPTSGDPLFPISNPAARTTSVGTRSRSGGRGIDVPSACMSAGSTTTRSVTA